MAESIKFKTFGFGMRALKKFPEIIPLATIMTTAVVGASAYIAYALYTKPDLQIVKKNELRFEQVKPEQSTKMININQQYKRIPELEALRQEIGSYKS